MTKKISTNTKKYTITYRSKTKSNYGILNKKIC